ncbi:sensor histidine kinase [Tenacibaculum agarivorans]|uniref:sensor histidine kinase n=1 Tax=Tenacibaculum agarivorans TaxID=1908389 RepID=UPI00094BB82F|nr:hypothetical protein [Tenacibaculum agarivorans]
MIRKIHILLFLFFIFTTTFQRCNEHSELKVKHGKATKFLDSLTNHYNNLKKQLPNDTTLVQVDQFIAITSDLPVKPLIYKGYMLKTSILSKQKKYNEAINTSYKLLKLAKENRDSAYMGKAHFKLGIYNSALTNHLTSFTHYNTSFQIHRNLKDSLLAAKRLLYMADQQKVLGDNVGSNITAIDGLKYISNFSDLKTISGLNHLIATNYRELQNSNQALLWNYKTLQLIKENEAIDKIGILNLLKFKNTKANIIADNGSFKESITLFTQLLKNKTVRNSTIEYARILSNLGKIKWLQDPNNGDSEQLLLEALAIRESNNIPSNLFASYIHLSKYYISKNSKKAMFYARNAYKNAILFNNEVSILESLDLITKIDPNAIQDLQKFKSISKSLSETQKKIRQIYAPTRFENERLTKEKILKEKQLAQEHEQKLWIISLFSLTIIGITIYIILYQKIQKQRNRIKEEQHKAQKINAAYEAEKRISKKIHDHLANDIHLIKMLVTNNADDPKILSKLNSVYNKARDISRESNDIDFENFDIELKEMMNSYISSERNIFFNGIDNQNWKGIENNKKIVLFRVLKELMVNMEKHSNCKIASIIFKSEENSLNIIYTDNGKGITEKTMTKKNGITIMENLIEGIGGTINFEVNRQNGIKVLLKFPHAT